MYTTYFNVSLGLHVRGRGGGGGGGGGGAILVSMLLSLFFAST